MEEKMRVEKKILKEVEEKDIELLQKEPEKFWGDANKIGKRAFWRITNLSEIEIPNAIVSIDDGAFAYCKNLKGISIPSSVKNIGKYAFWGCEELEFVKIADGVERIGENFLGDCKNLKAITFENKNSLPGGVKKAIKILNFQDYEINGTELTFIRDVANSLELMPQKETPDEIEQNS